MRGEKGNYLLPLRRAIGSSPRAWGKARTTEAMACGSRIIPTCVGKRPTSRDLASRSPDHPHVRGEKFVGVHCPRLHGGSSPRAWGKEQTAVTEEIRDWIIPTCVGKRRAGALLLVRRIIPACVGKMSRAADAVVVGSSHAWERITRYRETLFRRIIPMWGKDNVSVTISEKTDHPHVRGERQQRPYRVDADHPTCVGKRKMAQRNIYQRVGSSPRAWGKAGQCTVSLLNAGSSPRAWKRLSGSPRRGR